MSDQSGADSDSSFNLDVVDDYEPAPKRAKKDKNLNYLKITKPPVFRAKIPFEEVNRTLKFFNSPFEPVRLKYCADKRSMSDRCYYDKTLGHFCCLIKKAILRHEWSKIPTLLIAYINEDKTGKYHSGIVAKYATIYLLNDPIAKKNKLLTELFNTVLASKNKEYIKLFFKRCLSLPYMIQYKSYRKS